jgi:hypothetical protein
LPKKASNAPSSVEVIASVNSFYQAAATSFAAFDVGAIGPKPADNNAFDSILL